MDRNRLISHRLNNLFHALLLLGGLGLLLLAIGWVLAGPTGVAWTLAVGLGGLLLSPRLSPALILRMYRARQLSPAEAPGLHALVERLAAVAGLPARPVLYTCRPP